MAVVALAVVLVVIVVVGIVVLVLVVVVLLVVNEMGGACGTYGGRERCAQDLVGET